jgi:hypothetical protein
MKKLFTLFLLISTYSIQAQTWDGSASNDWNTAANWSTNTVPIATGNVTIPNVTALPNFPKLASNITLNNLTANTASKIDFNGFKITINVSMDFDGCELNNTKPNTDIVLDLGGTAASILYFRNNLVNDNITINHNSNAILYEAYQGGNIYEQNFTLNALGASAFFTCYDTKSEYKGNITIIRSVSGNSNIFRVGTLGVLGNFTFTNNFGGSTIIGETTANSDIIINGKINIECKPNAGNHLFKIYKTKNLTAGGNIDTKNLGHIIFSENNLIVTNLIMNGFASNSLSDFINNTITANVEITELPTNAFYSYFRGNTINGNTVILLNSSNAFYEAYQFGNTFNGNFNMDVAGSGATFVCYDTPSLFNGNLTIKRSNLGPTEIFRKNALNVDGDFSYTNNVGGNTTIGGAQGVFSNINGTVNIISNTVLGNPNFFIYRIKNNTNGGNISISKPGQVEIIDNELKINNLDVINFKSNALTDVKGNTIGGNLTITEDPLNSYFTYLRGNTILGNTVITSNSSNIFYQGYQFSDKFLGDATFHKIGTGNILLSYDTPVEFHKNLYLNSSAGIFFNGTVHFKGNKDAVLQQLGTQQGYAENLGINPYEIKNLVIDKEIGSSLILTDTLEIVNNVNFISGKIKTAPGKVLMIDYLATTTGFSNISFVEGPLWKAGGVLSNYTFPIGFGNRLAAITVSPFTSATNYIHTYWHAEYVPSNVNQLYNIDQKDVSLDHLSTKEYWNLSTSNTQPIGAIIIIGWDATRQSGVTNMTNLRVAGWNPFLNKWVNRGNSQVTGNNSVGTIKSNIMDIPINPLQPWSGPFTLASSSTDNPFLSNCISTKTGNWSDETVWSCGREPLSTDPVTINPPHIVTLTTGIFKAQNITFSGGTIKLNTGSNLVINP